MSDVERVKDILKDEKWHCGNQFRERYLPEFRSRINDIRKQRIEVKSEPCSKVGCPRTHKGSSHSYKLLSPKRVEQISKPEDGQTSMFVAARGSSAYRKV